MNDRNQPNQSALDNSKSEEDRKIWINHLCVFTGLPYDVVEAALNTMKDYIKDRAEKENKTEEEVIKELTKSN